MAALHLITCEYPPLVGGVSEHSRVLAETAAAAGYDVHVWTGAPGAASEGVHVRPELGDFSASALARADAALNECAAPRRLVVQWVPHGYGRRGLNVGFSRWIRRRARAGDVVDLIVHEPFMDFFGPSWRQPLVALVQRYMTWMMVRDVERVWLTIPGWGPRVRFARRRDQSAPVTLPVPGTIPPVRDTAAVAALRRTLLAGRSQLIGCFGSSGRYAQDAISAAVAGLASRHTDAAVVCFGRGSDALAREVTGKGGGIPVTGAGALELRDISLHLQACDALVQPYPDGVSGRRTTTVSAMEHGVPVATTMGLLSETFWGETPAVEAVPADAPAGLSSALISLLDPARNAAARAAATALYRQRFDPALTLKALLAAPHPPRTEAVH